MKGEHGEEKRECSSAEVQVKQQCRLYCLLKHVIYPTTYSKSVQSHSSDRSWRVITQQIIKEEAVVVEAV